MSEIDEKELERRFEAISQFQPDSELTARDIERVRESITGKMNTKQPAKQNIWRIIMKSKITKLAAAAPIIIAAILSLLLLDKSTTPAYAVQQTINAIKKIKTVYMAGEFYRQGKFECWMKYDGHPSWPTHVWLGRAGHNLCKICSPAGVFGLNKRTNRVHFAKRDERHKDWIIKFDSFFKESVKQAKKSDAVEIYNEKDAKTGKELIVIDIKTPKRHQKFLIDPDTKLPISFSTIKDDAPMEMMRKTLAVKNLTEIRYNQQPPDGIFDLPKDAVIVTEEVDCMVDPDSGLVVDDMSREQACLEIVKQTGRALIDIDIETLCRLDLFFRLYTPEIWELTRQMKADGQWADKLTITGDPYQKGDIWYVPCEARMQDGKTEVTTPMIKFYEFEGKTYCFIIGSKEKGIVD